MSYLVFPRVRVQAANMLSASFLMGGPPVFAAYGLGEALCFHLDPSKGICWHVQC